MHALVLEEKHTFLFIKVFMEVEIVLILLQKSPVFRFITTAISNTIGCVSQPFEVCSHTFKKNYFLNEWFKIAKPIFFLCLFFKQSFLYFCFLKATSVSCFAAIP